METRLKRWLLMVGVLAAVLLYVNVEQARTIAQQRHELVKELQTLISSQHDEVALQQQLHQSIESCQK